MPPTSNCASASSYTREFGMVISAGSGGLDAELGERNFRKDRAVVHAAVELTDAEDFLGCSAHDRLSEARGDRPSATDGRSPTPTSGVFRRGCSRSRAAYAPGNPDAPFVLRTLELDPVHVGERLTARRARCEIRRAAARRLARPIHKIDKLLHPASIGIIGVSATSMNFGRIILRNLMGSGYAKERLTIIRPGETEIDGVKCVASLKALDHKLDLLIVAVSADAVYGLVDEIIETDAVEAVMLIPGSLGETRKSREPAAGLAARINAAHGKEGGGPIFLGANCLGVVSHPGSYDSWFIPLERLPKPQKKPERNSVMLSQSGAFMITRMSQNPWLDPRYMLALGNQTDLTHGDLLATLRERPEIETIGVYLEGFKDGDGLDFVRGRAPGGTQRQGGRRLQGGQDRARHRRRPGPHGVDRRRSDAVRIRGAPRGRDRRRGFHRLRRSVLHRGRAAPEEDRRQAPGRDQRRGLRGRRHGRFDRSGDLLDGDGCTRSRARSSASRRSSPPSGWTRWWR